MEIKQIEHWIPRKQGERPEHVYVQEIPGPAWCVQKQQIFYDLDEAKAYARTLVDEAWVNRT